MLPKVGGMIRLTQYAVGGGCACKLPAGRLEELLAGLGGQRHPGLLVGLDTGDDAAAVRVAGGRAVLSTADFFTPVVDSAYDWGRIAAANALSDIYAMGGEPILAINLLAWPAELDDPDLIGDVFRGALDVATLAGCPIGGGHSITGPEPVFGLAVTGLADPEHLLRNDIARPGMPLTLTKPLGVGILGNRHKATGEVFPEAIAQMTTLNADASRAALAAGITSATDVTGFGLLGHLFKLCRASGIGAVVDRDAVPLLAGVRESLADGYLPGGSRRNLEWVRGHLDPGRTITQEDLLILADAQTSGGLLLVGEIPGGVVIGQTVARAEPVIAVR